MILADFCACGADIKPILFFDKLISILHTHLFMNEKDDQLSLYSEFQSKINCGSNSKQKQHQLCYPQKTTIPNSVLTQETNN